MSLQSFKFFQRPNPCTASEADFSAPFHSSVPSLTPWATNILICQFTELAQFLPFAGCGCGRLCLSLSFLLQLPVYSYYPPTQMPVMQRSPLHPLSTLGHPVKIFHSLWYFPLIAVLMAGSGAHGQQRLFVHSLGSKC